MEIYLKKRKNTPEKEALHLQMIPVNRWLQYYEDLLTENRLRVQYRGTKNITSTQTDGERVEVGSKEGSERAKKWEIMCTRGSTC